MSQLSTKQVSPRSNRKDDRLAICLPVEIQLPDKPGMVLAGEIRNISEGGAYIVSYFPIQVGQKIVITLKFKQLHSFQVLVVANPKLNDDRPPESSVVRWTDPTQSGAFGVEFSGLDAPTRDLIQSLIRYFHLLKKAGVKF